MEKPQMRASGRRFSPSRRVIILSVLALLIVLIALAIGLGIGLTRHHNNNGSSSQPTNGTAPAGSPPINGTFWQPSSNTTWQIVLENALALSSSNASISPDVQVFDIDLFDNADTVISALHGLDKKVICYFSAGSYEPNRPDSSEFQASDMGKVLSGWPGEKWLNISSPNVQRIIGARIQLASQKSCDAVDPDNVDGYQNDNGLGLTANDSISYMTFLSNQAHTYNLSIGLKNALDILPSLANEVQFAVNEQCVEYDECSSYSPLFESNKAVFHIKYVSGTMSSTEAASSGTVSNACSVGNLSTVVKDMDLDGWVEYCGGFVANTPTANS